MAGGTKVGSIYYDLDLDDRKFKQGASSVKQDLRGLEGAFANAEHSSKLFLGAITAVGAAGAAAVGFGIKIAGDLESARQGFVALLGSAEEADKTMARIKKEAAATPFELPGLVAGAQALTAVTKNGDQAINTLLDVGKAIAVSGKGQAELDRVVMNLQEIASTGRVTAMDIRQFQRAIPIFNDILASVGMTTEELQNSDNAAEILFEAFKKSGEAGGIAEKGFEAQAGTFNQLWSNLMDSVGIGLSDFVKISGIFDAVKFALDGVINAINRFTKPEEIYRFMNFFKDWGLVVAGIIIGGITPALKGMAKAFWLNIKALSPFMIWGMAIGLILQLIINHFGGIEGTIKAFGELWVWLKGKLQPFFDFFMQKVERVKQILAGFGISGEFGGLINFFSVLPDKLSFYTERALQIIGPFVDTVKTKLAGFAEGQDASWIDVMIGMWDRVQPVVEAIKATLEPIGQQLATTAAIIDAQVKPAWDALLEVLQPFWEEVGPYVVAILKFIGAVIIGIVVTSILTLIAIVLGLVTAISNALPYIVQAFEGLIQFIRGFVQIITGLLSGDLGMVIEGVKQMFKGAYDFVSNTLTALLKFISGFVKGVVNFFLNLYNELVGNSIVPDLVNEIVAWFKKLPEFVKNAISGLADIITSPFKKAWSYIEPILNKMKDGLDKINPFHRESPSLVDNVRAGVDEIMYQYGRLGQLQVPAVVDALGGAGGSSTNQDIDIYIDKVGDQQDITAIGRELGFRAGIMPR